LNPGILLGPRFQDMAINLMKNLEEDRLRVVRAILGITGFKRKPNITPLGAAEF